MSSAELEVFRDIRSELEDIAEELRNINETLKGIREDETVRGQI